MVCGASFLPSFLSLHVLSIFTAKRCDHITSKATTYCNEWGLRREGQPQTVVVCLKMWCILWGDLIELWAASKQENGKRIVTFTCAAAPGVVVVTCLIVIRAIRSLGQPNNQPHKHTYRSVSTPIHVATIKPSQEWIFVADRQTTKCKISNQRITQIPRVHLLSAAAS